MSNLTSVLITLLLMISSVTGAVINVQLENPPASGSLVCLLYNSANTFGDLRESFRAERFQVLGPSVRIGLLGSGKSRLAATLKYRIGVYEEDDSPFLQGMGDRRDTAMLGLAYQAELGAGLEATLGYQHDILDQIGGGSAQVSVGKAFQWGITRLTPNVGLNWLSSSMSNYDYGVASNRARAGRPAYKPGASWSPEIGLGTLVEVSRNWLVIGNLGVELLDNRIRKSPIVSEDYVLTFFLAVNYVF